MDVREELLAQQITAHTDEVVPSVLRRTENDLLVALEEVKALFEDLDRDLWMIAADRCDESRPGGDPRQGVVKPFSEVGPALTEGGSRALRRILLILQGPGDRQVEPPLAKAGNQVVEEGLMELGRLLGCQDGK